MRLLLRQFCRQYDASRRPDDRVSHCIVQHWFWFSNRSLISHAIIVRLEEWKVVGRLGRVFCIICSHLASFSMSPVYLGAMRRRSLSNGANLATPSKPRVREKEVQLTGPAATALHQCPWKTSASSTDNNIRTVTDASHNGNYKHLSLFEFCVKMCKYEQESLVHIYSVH